MAEVALAPTRAVTARKPLAGGLALRRSATGIGLLTPSLIFLIPFTIWPAIKVVYDSFFLHDLAHPKPQFIGLGNFITEFSNPDFILVLKNTAIYTIGTVPISVILALLLAVEVNKKLRAAGLYRTLLFYPTMLPTIGAAAIWLFIYAPDLGLLDRFLGLFGLNNYNWLGDPALVLPALMIIMIWKQTGYFMVFYLAGLQSMPNEVFEAADLDGASGWRALRSLTLPLLSGTTVFVSTIALVESFQTVDQLFILTLGGPDNASNLLLYWLYQEGFRNFNFGRASAVTVIMMVLLLTISLVNYHYLDRSAHYEN